MIVYIPILLICLNGNCEFMQSTGYFVQEQVCQDDLDRQKQHMKNLARQAGPTEITTLEGTCVDFDTSKLQSQRPV